MPTLQEEVALLTAATNNLITEVQTKKASLDTSEANAAASAASAAADAQTITDNIVPINTVSDNIATVNNVSTNMSSILARYEVGPIEPVNPGDGMQWFDTLTRQSKLWDGGTWNVFKVTSFSPTIAYSFGRKTIITLDEDSVGAENVVNGNFATGDTTGFSVGASVVTNNALVVTDLFTNPINAILTHNLEGKLCKVTFEVKELLSTTATAKVKVGHDGVYSSAFIPTVGVHTLYLIAGSNAFDILLTIANGASSPSFTVDNISVKEVFRKKGDRYLQNVGTDGVANDIDLYGSNHLKLDSALSEALPVKIPHTLGAEIIVDPLLDTPASWNVSNVVVSSGQAAFTVTAGSMAYMFNAAHDLLAGNYYLVEVDVSSFTGTGSFGLVSGPGNNVANTPSFNTTGKHQFVYYAATNIADVGLKRVSVTGDYSCVVDSFSIKQITNPNSFLSYFDVTTKKIETLGNSVDGGSSIELAEAVPYIAGTNTVNATITDNGDNTFTFSSDSASADQFSPQVAFADNTKFITDKTYKLRFKVKNIGVADAYVNDTFHDAHYSPYPRRTLVPNEEYTFEYTYKGVDGGLWDYMVQAGNTTSGQTLLFSEISMTEVVPISTTYSTNKSVSNIFATTVLPTQADRDYIENVNPEAVAQLVAGELVPELSFTAAQVYSYYPCNEGLTAITDGGRYLVNNIKVQPDLRTLVFGSSYWNTATGVIHSSTADSFDAEITVLATPGSNDYQQSFSFGGNNLAPYTSYRLSFDMDIVSGAVELKYIYCRKANSFLPFITSSGSYSVIGNTGTEVASDFIFAFENETSLFRVAVTNIKFEVIDASEIQNYTDACRTTFENTNYGMSKYLLKEDLNTGRMLGVADDYTVGFRDSANVFNTGWIPDITKDWSYEIVLDRAPTVKPYNMYGVHATGGNDRIIVGTQGYGNYGYIRIGSQVYNYGTAPKNHIIACFRSIDSTIDIYRNGIKIVDNITTLLLANTVSAFGLGGKLDVDNNPILAELGELDIGMFKAYPNKVLTQQEVTSAYNAAKILYPTLP